MPEDVEVVEDPEAPALRGDDEVVVLEGEVGDGHQREVVLQLLPIRTVVGADVEPEFGAGIQQTGHGAVCPDDAGEVAVIDALGDGRPRGAIVDGVVEIGLVIARLVAGGGEVESAGPVRVDVDAVDHGVDRHALWCHVGPISAAVPGHVHQAVVGAAPQEAGLEVRFGRGENGGVVLDARVVLGNGPAGGDQLLGLVAGEVRADDVPAAAAVGRDVEVLRAGVQLLGIVGGEEDREVPLEAVLHALGAGAHGVVRPDVDGAVQVPVVVESGEEAAIAAAVDDVVVDRVRRQMGALAAGGGFPVALADEAAGGADADADGRIVLLGPVDAVGEMVVCGDAVELRRRLVHVGRPAFAGIVADLGAAVVADDEPAGVLRGDPEVVVVAVRRVLGLEGAPAIGGDVVGDVHDVHPVDVFGVGVDAGVVPGALAQAAVGIGPLPRLAGIVRAVDAALVVLQDGPHAVRVHRRHSHTDDTKRAFRHALPLHEGGPTGAAVLGFPEGRSRPARGEVVGRAPHVPGAGVEDFRVDRIEDEVHGARSLVGKQHALPAFSAVGRFVDAPLVAVGEEVAQHGGVDDVRVVGVDADARDVAGCLEADGRPAPAAVDALV